MTSSKEIFRAFCEKEKSIPLFLTFDWLDTVAADKWDVVMEEKNGDIVAFIPYTFIIKSGFKLIELPHLTPYGGVWIKYQEGQKYSTRLSYEKEIFTALINKLPPFDSFTQKFNPEFTNWLPFFWKGFKETTAYTYLIENLNNPELLFSEFKENIRREIRKAEKTISISASNEIDILYNLKVRSYELNKMKLNIDVDYLKNLFQLCIQKNIGELLIAKDELNNIHSAALFVRDQKTTYYLYGASDPEFKNSGAMSLLMWEAIQRSSTHSKQFNFEGSMIEEVERFFRGFGARQTPYFLIKKTNSKILKIKYFLSDLIK